MYVTMFVHRFITRNINIMEVGPQVIRKSRCPTGMNPVFVGLWPRV